MDKSTALFLKIMPWGFFTFIPAVSLLGFSQYLRLNRPHEMDTANGYVMLYTERGINYFLAQTDWYIIFGLFAWGTIAILIAQFNMYRLIKAAKQP